MGYGKEEFSGYSTTSGSKLIISVKSMDNGKTKHFREKDVDLALFVYVPRRQFEELYINSVNGYTNIADIIVRDIRVKSLYSQIEIMSDVIVKDLHIETKKSSIKVLSPANKTTLKVVKGDIKYDVSANCNLNIDFEIKSGIVLAKFANIKEISIDTSSVKKLNCRRINGDGAYSVQGVIKCKNNDVSISY